MYEIISDGHISKKPTATATDLTLVLGSRLKRDMWKQLKKVSIPVFSGDKRKYQSWRAAFIACVDKAPCSEEYKLLQLRQYLAGSALQCVDNLGHSTAAYAAGMERLGRK